MKFSGPRMFFHHPLLSLLHFMDKWRKAPDFVKKEERTSFR